MVSRWRFNHAYVPWADEFEKVTTTKKLKQVRGIPYALGAPKPWGGGGCWSWQLH